MPTSVNISTIGLEGQERTILSVASNLLLAYGLSIRVLDEGNDSGHILVIDGTKPAGRAAQPRAGQVCLYLGQRPGAGGYTIERPVRVQALKDLIQDVYTRHQGEIASWSGTRSAPATQDAPAPQLLKVLPEEADTLLGALTLAARRQVAIRLYWGFEDKLLLDGASFTGHTRLEEAELESIARARKHSLQIEAVTPVALKRAAEGARSVPFGRLAWQSAFFANPGRNYLALPVDAPIRMQSWPRFPSRLVRPEYMRLTAMLSKKPLSVQQLLELTRLPEGIVWDLVHCLYLERAIEVQTERPAVAPAPTPTVTSATRGLLAKIARRLSLGGKS